jgi:hypothetical protein
MNPWLVKQKLAEAWKEEVKNNGKMRKYNA